MAVAKRGVVKEFTQDTEKRLKTALANFLDRLGTKRAFWITLTTRETDPAKAKFLLRRWIAAMRYKFGVFEGVYCMEFDGGHFVHYHAVISIPSVADYSNDRVRKDVKDIWEKCLGPQMHHSACKLERVDAVKDRSWLIWYMTKADDDFGIPHRKRWQKAPPPPFAERGIRALWWGCIGRGLPLGTARTHFSGDSFAGDAEPQAA